MTGQISIPILQTARLVLRGPNSADFDAYAAFSASDRSIYVGGPAEPANAWQKFCALAGQWIARGYGRWIVVDRQTDAPVGVVGLNHPLEWPEPELSWAMFEAGEGKGYAFEAAVAARDYAYDTLGWQTIISFVDLENARSVALAKRLGCVQDGVSEHSLFGPMNIWRHPSSEALQ